MALKRTKRGTVEDIHGFIIKVLAQLCCISILVLRCGMRLQEPGQVSQNIFVQQSYAKPPSLDPVHSRANCRLRPHRHGETVIFLYQTW